ncbi:hypothetical protein [Tepidimonas sp.]|uniref:hypothetical protein n=1 Tax=Tepidimonas sp. TaxID=2002775 RepID=UPI003919B72F
MEIAHSAIHLHSQMQQTRATVLHERLQAWRGPRPGDAGGAPPTRVPASTAAGSRPSAQVELSPQALAARQAKPSKTPDVPDAPSAAEDAAEHASLDPRLRTLVHMIEALTGLRVRVFQAENWPDAASAEAVAQVPSGVPSAASPNGAAGEAPASVGWGLAYDRVEIRVESQSLAFQASGRVVLTDGRTIDFRLGLQLQSSSVDVRTLSLRAGDAALRLKDPLVLSLDGAAPSLTDTRFVFDLDADGTAESMAFVASGSGFLALDRNGNGAIDDGRELFGATSGDGFADLAALDSDGNGWIDAADPAFGQLRVWTRDGADGGDRLQTLAQAGVGALYLGRIATPFALGDAGRLRSSGLYLTEAGTARTLQQIDLAV